MRSSKTVLVAGGAGFIGTNLCRALLDGGAHVICLDSFLTGSPENLRSFEREPRLIVVEADVADPLPEFGRVDEIYNLACAASPKHYQLDPVHTMMTSVLGTRNLLALAKEVGGRFLQTSTSEVYGDPEQHPQTEAYFGNVNPTGPRACYDEGKRAAEALCYDYARTLGADVRVARIFNTYGPHMRPDDGRIVSNVICQALTDNDITVYGNGRQTRSFCYIDDMVEGLLRLMRHDGADRAPVNLGNPNEMPISALVDTVLAATKSRSRVTFEPLPVDDPRRRRPDISRARTLLDWEPKVQLDEGLVKTIAWFAGLLERQGPGVPRAAAAAIQARRADARPAAPAVSLR